MQLIVKSYLPWKNDNLDGTDETENEERAGHISSETIINLFGVLKTEKQLDISFLVAQLKRK